MRSLSDRVTGRHGRRWMKALSWSLLPCAVGVTIHSTVAAQATAGLRDVSDGLALSVQSLETAEGAGDPTEQVVWVNGAQFRVTVRHTERTPAAVLDEAAKRCVVSSFGTRWWASWLPEPVFRTDGGGGGMVACLVPESPWTEVESLARALDAFSFTGRVDAVGDVDWLRVSPADQGATVTHFRSQGPIDLSRIFTEQGDAEGADPARWARPPGARRVLSAAAVGSEPALAGYECPLTGAKVLAWYRKAAARAGWRAVTSDGDSDGVSVLAFGSGERTLLVAVERSDAGSLVTVIRVR